VAFVNEITEHAKGRSGKELKKYIKRKTGRIYQN